ncbi:SUMF1/EgtB/PvdO family nonheme iron enzyme [Bacillus sp. CECT 9360]|uniref:formylglycine-generating enzyme family protein n=1 Tax=Bacillus sp. CECT 9360 TaxID=2845821 RepID=UPI001E63736D|nr:SUMF1/EgtB/PvdO family nonheme iron enzyme [Bacillus sp. CECT 9360]CAH0344115.1 Formylglycine-generating enzyme [Bacillus sp. CECT 9360]
MPKHNNDSAQSDHPVTGIDWYDAYAFAAWKGKKVPTTDQWEKAARGVNGYDYHAEENFINDFIHAFDIEDFSINKWREILIERSDIIKTHSVFKKDSNKSPFGIIGMIGNTWEWTRTRYMDQKEQEPTFRGMDKSLVWDD